MHFLRVVVRNLNGLNVVTNHCFWMVGGKPLLSAVCCCPVLRRARESSHASVTWNRPETRMRLTIVHLCQLRKCDVLTTSFRLLGKRRGLCYTVTTAATMAATRIIKSWYLQEPTVAFNLSCDRAVCKCRGLIST